MSNTYRGRSDVIQQSVARRWDPNTGYVEEAEHRGFDYAAFLTRARFCEFNGFPYEWETRHGVHSMRATDTRGEFTIDTWEIGLNKLSPSSLKNPRNISAIGSDVLKYIALFVRGELTLSDGSPETYTGLYDFMGTQGDVAAQRLLQRMVVENSDAYYLSGYVLRHTTNVGNRWSRNVADYGVDCIYTTAQLLSEAQNAGLWTFPLPGRLVFKIADLSATFINRYGPLPYYQWGWLKSGSTESTAANNRVNIQTEYEFQNWSTDEYRLL